MLAGEGLNGVGCGLVRGVCDVPCVGLSSCGASSQTAAPRPHRPVLLGCIVSRRRLLHSKGSSCGNLPPPLPHTTRSLPFRLASTSTEEANWPRPVVSEEAESQRKLLLGVPAGG